VITRIVITCDKHTDDPIAAYVLPPAVDDPAGRDWRFDQTAMAAHGPVSHRGGIAAWYELTPPERQSRVSRLVERPDGTRTTVLTCSRCNNPVEVPHPHAVAACRAIAGTGGTDLPGTIEDVPRRVFLKIVKQVRLMQ
jgi:hypothetical protein